MSARTRMILAIVGAVLVVLVFFLFMVRPRQTELQDVKAEVAQEESLRLTLEADLARLQELQRNAPRLQAELERIRELIPRVHDVPTFIFQVNEAADESGVNFLQISPELPDTPPEGAAVAEVRLTIGGSGGYFAIQDFIRRLYSLERAVRIDVIDLSGAEGAGTTGTVISLTATARIFFESPGAAVAPAVPITPPAAPAATPAPAASPAAAPSPEG